MSLEGRTTLAGASDSEASLGPAVWNVPVFEFIPPLLPNRNDYLRDGGIKSLVLFLVGSPKDQKRCDWRQRTNSRTS